MASSPFLELERLTRSFSGTMAVRDASIRVGEHEIVTLLGPSGCGKTTTLRMVAGFERPDSGRLLLEGRDITGHSPQRRGFGMVFQHYALFPHLSVAENVAFGLQAAGVARTEIAQRVDRALALVRLPGTESRSISSLSGGQQQRVALARALAPEPRVLLLDEPLSNLDAALRERTRRELRQLVKQIGITTIYVTHDQEEAFDLSDRIAVMRDGLLEQLGPPEELYHRPENEFVATFLGRAIALPAVVGSSDGGEVVTCRLTESVEWPALAPRRTPLPEGLTISLLVRPESIRLMEPDSPGALPGRVADRRFAGAFHVYRVDLEVGEVEVQTAAGEARPGERVGVGPKAAPSGLFAFPAGS